MILGECSTLQIVWVSAAAAVVMLVLIPAMVFQCYRMRAYGTRLGRLRFEQDHRDGRLAARPTKPKETTDGRQA